MLWQEKINGLDKEVEGRIYSEKRKELLEAGEFGLERKVSWWPKWTKQTYKAGN